MTKTPGKIPSLDGIRALSILLVIGCHSLDSYRCPPALTAFRWLLSGDLGVTIFFVLSGYLITTLLLKEKNKTGQIDCKAFYIRRFFRIFPVFYLYVLVVLCLDQWQQLGLSARLYVHALTYTMNFAGAGTWLLGHAWSLGVEEQFYLLWPWVMRAKTATVSRVAVGLIVLAPVARIVAYKLPAWELYLLVPFVKYADSLMIGAGMALLAHTNPVWARHPILARGWFRVVAILLIFGVEYFSLQGRLGIVLLPFGRTLSSVLVAGLIFGAIHRTNDRLFAFLNHPVMVWAGVLSYSLYVWQQIFLYDARFPAGQVWWRMFPVNIGLVFLVSWLSYRFWESPFLRLKERFSRI
ncbi:MAG: acyltransferase [Blastocatellia bacterium]|nr:acyltransferase [Blastocatellia bacterium]